MRIQLNLFRAFSYLLVVVALSGLLVNAGGEQLWKRSPHVFFYTSRLLQDGEQQRVIHYGGVTVKETSALVPSSPVPLHDQHKNAPAATNDSFSSPGIRLVQVTDGKHLVQAVFYSDYKMKDCEYVRDKDAVEEFLSSLNAEFEAAAELDAGKKSANVKRDEEKVNGNNVTYGGVINLKLLRHTNDLFPESRRLVNYRWIRKECKILHNKMKEVMREAERHSDAATSRKKRELFIYPGTNWCGVGSATEGFNDLGWNAEADRCCRQHDHCPHIIESFSKKYNLFNYRFHTLSHCECDERFRTCLKMVNNAPSNLVGKLFFNVVQMKCFVLKSEKTCVKRSWWGRCLKHDKQVQAHERDVLTY